MRALRRLSVLRSLAPTIFLMIVASCGLPARLVQAATYYVDGSAAVGGNGNSWATACKTITAGLAYATQAGDVLEISGGTYNETLTLTRNGLTVLGSTASGHNTPVTIKGVGDTAVLTVTGQTTWQRITFDGSANTDRDRPVVSTSGGPSTFEACVIGPGQRLVKVGSGGATFNRCTLQQARRGDKTNPAGSGYSGYGPVVVIAATTSDAVVFNYCLFGDMEYGYIQPQAASRVELNNCLLAGFSGDVLYIGSDPSGNTDATIPNGVLLQNCLAIGNNFSGSAIIENSVPSVAVTLTNCLIQPGTPIAMAAAKYSGNVTEIRPLTPGSPGLTHGRRQALVNIGIDDAANIGIWTQVAALCNARGFHTTLALDAAAVTSAADWATLQTAINAGNEVAAHTSHHVYLPETGLLTLAYNGSGATATVTTTHNATTGLDPATNLTLKVGSTTVLSLNLTPTARITEVVTAIANVSGFTAATIAIAGTTYNTGPVLAQDLNAITDSSIANSQMTATPTTLSRNDAQFFYDEISVPKATIEANLKAPGSANTPYTCSSFIYPFLGGNETVIAATGAAGFTAARGGYAGSYAMGGYYAYAGPGDITNSGYNLLNSWSVEPQQIFSDNGNPTILAQQVSALLEWAKFTGTALALYSHGANEYTIAQWTALLDRLAADPGVMLGTLQELRTYITANADSSVDEIYVRTTWPSVANYAPVPTSPLLRAGAAYSVSKVDFGGRTVPAGTIPSVGLYQWAGDVQPTVIPAINTLLLLQ